MNAFVPAAERHGMSPEAREALIEQRRTMREVAEYGRVNRARIDAEWDALEEVPLTIDQHIAHVRKLRLGGQL